jgi:hypothetical protein
MPTESVPPAFDAFCRWLVSTANRPVTSDGGPSAPKGATAQAARYEALITAARSARYVAPRYVEALQLLAAADRSGADRPPELTTARGFRVTIAYDDGADRESSSICVLVRCPSELVGQLKGETAYLWNGTERFELGQFDTDGKAIGTLPAGIEITLSDFSSGRVKLDEPPPADG